MLLYFETISSRDLLAFAVIIFAWIPLYLFKKLVAFLSQKAVPRLVGAPIFIWRGANAINSTVLRIMKNE